MPTKDDDRPAGEVEPFDPGFKIYLREWRQKRGLTQDQLATLTAADKSMISRYERWQRGLTLEMLFKLCSALRITPAQFFSDPEEESADAMLDGVPFADRRRALDILRVLTGKQIK